MVSTAYDFNTGLPLTVTDDFGQTTEMEYNDPLLRPTKVKPIVVNGVATGPVTETIYGDTPGNLFVKVRKQLDATNWDEATTYSDGLGRAIKTQAKDSQGDVFVETKYDNLGRVAATSNPYRNGDTVYWSKPRYDEFNRVVETYAPASGDPLDPNIHGASLGVTSFGISTVNNASGNFIGTAMTTTDASQRKGRSITNALGQLIRVDEPTAIGGTADADLGTLATPSQPTFYKYNVQGKMVEVTQGVQTRWFKYDSLGRLIRVCQPEQQANSPALDLTDEYSTSGQWTAAFSYDVLGNVLTATDAKNTIITNAYDRASRVKTRTYSDSTPPVSFYYDGKGLTTPQTPNFAKGKLTRVFSTVSETKNTVFDNFGRLKETQQITDGNNYTSKYIYNLSGASIEEEYPSGRKVKNEFESDGDLMRIFGKKNATATEQTYANAFSYTPDGKIEKLRLGNGLWEAAKFNSRMQTTEIALGHGVASGDMWRLGYEYGELNTDGTVNTTKNTGNIAKQTLSFNGLAQPFVQSYKYDSLYRLTEAKETAGTGTSAPQTWIQQFGYDRFGNRTSTTQTVNAVNINTTPAIDQNTNRFTSTNYQYDSNGNLTRDLDANNQTRTIVFNGDNKQTEVKDANGNWIGRYFYDGEGKRVKKKVYDSSGVLTEETIFVYSSGKLIAEYSTAPPPANPTTNYIATDMLGSPRVLANAVGEVISRRDFLPFGEEIYADGIHRTANGKYSPTGQDSVRKRFTGYEKDRETGFDFAENRMYENRHGRFTAVDPLLASGKSALPQTFNRYVYVGNNPILRVDPLGLIWGVKGRTVRWFKTEEEMKKKGFAQQNEYYKTSAGNWVYLNPNGPNRGARNSFDRDGWTFVEARNVPSTHNPENMRAMSGDDDASENNTIRGGFLFMEFATGTGKQERFFGPNSILSKSLQTSPEVTRDREEFCSSGCGSLRNFFRQGFNGERGQFTATGFPAIDYGIFGQQGSDNNSRALLDMNETRAIIGSFSIEIRETNSATRSTSFTVTNTMNLWSLGAHILPERPFNPATTSEFSRPFFTTTKQTIQWTEINPCRCR